MKRRVTIRNLPTNFGTIETKDSHNSIVKYNNQDIMIDDGMVKDPKPVWN